MKTILAFGDGLTHGVEAVTGRRLSYEDRWPSVLEAELADQAQVIAEGLAGRTSVFDDERTFVQRNGSRLLPTLLHTHSPLDLVILFLGINDLKTNAGGTALSAAEGIRRLVEIVWRHPYRANCGIPEILIVSPPPISSPDDLADRPQLRRMAKESVALADHYSRVARQLGCGFFDAGSVVTLNGIHLDAQSNGAIGRALAPAARSILSL